MFHVLNNSAFNEYRALLPIIHKSLYFDRMWENTGVISVVFEQVLRNIGMFISTTNDQNFHLGEL